MCVVAAGVVGAAVVGVAGSALSASAQSSAANTAAGEQEQAAQLQANTSSDVYNVQQVQNQPARVAGGEALQREAYLLGLDPNLNISGDTSIAQINPQLGDSSNQNEVTWTGAGSQGITSQTNPNGINPATGMQNSGVGSNANGSYGNINGVPTGPTVTPGTANTQPIALGSQGAMAMSALQQSGQVPTNGMSPMQTMSGPTNTLNTVTSTGGTTNPSNSGLSINPISGTPNTGSTSGGYGSLSSVYNPSTFYNDPSYQFELGQAELAGNKQEAASGGLYSTGALDNALQYAQGLAATDYNNAFNRSQSAQNQQFNYLQALTGGGQVGTNNVTSAGNTAASNINSAAAGYGNAASAGTIGAANAFSSGVNSATGQVANAFNAYNNNGYYSSGAGSNPQNLGGATEVAPAGSQLTYDQWGNITGSTPITTS